MIFGNWHPVGALGAGMLFGFADSLASKLAILKVPIPNKFLEMGPYIITMVVLAGVVGRGQPPAHRETPGLGDFVVERRTDWIRQFDRRSLDSPPHARWQVRRDGGDFDQYTGATITSRAVTRAVRDALNYVARHHAELFAPGSPEAP